MTLTPLIRALAVAGAVLATPLAAHATPLPPHHRAHRHAAATVPPAAGDAAMGERARRYRAESQGDTSGFPGHNEFNPSAPYGGQAAVTAAPGTNAYKEQMNQRRYFCEWASNRC